MGVGEFIKERGGHIAGFRSALDQKIRGSLDDFVGFFDGSKDVEDAFIRGAWDFSRHIAGPVAGFLGDPTRMAALEIGYGGGRLLASAARHFAHVYGIDIHGQSQEIQGLLRSRGATNIDLLQGDGVSFPLKDASIDFAYSFIVFQHLELISVLEANLRETSRVLKQNGFAVIYFGRLARWSLYGRSRLCNAIDRVRELTPLLPDFIEKQARVNETNLLVSLRYMRRLAAAAGFQVLSDGVSRRREAQGVQAFGGQRYVVLRRL